MIELIENNNIKTKGELICMEIENKINFERILNWEFKKENISKYF